MKDNSQYSAYWFIVPFVVCEMIVIFISYFLFGIHVNDVALCVITLIGLLPPTAIALIAYYQLAKLANININDHLMQLDKLWHTSEIIMARKIIDNIFQKTYRIKNKGKNEFDTAVAIASQEIYELSRPDTDEKNREFDSKFIYVLALIEFFDTLGFLYKNGNENERKHIRELFNDSAIFYYKINKVYIEHCSKIQGASNRFKNFIELYKEFDSSERA